MTVTGQELNLQIQAKMFEALNSREQEFSTLTKLLDDVVFRCDSEGSLCLLNEAWEKTLGWTVSESIDKKLLDFQDPEWQSEGFPTLVESADNYFSGEIRLLSKDGSKKTFNLKATFANGSWYGSLSNVTAYHETLAALETARESERKLSLVASRTDNLVIISDSKGAIEWVNASFERDTGYSFDEVVGRRPSELLQGDKTDQKTIGIMRKGLESGEGFNVEVINYSKSGEDYWVEIECTPIVDGGGDLINFIAVERIITERKEAERALRESERNFRTILDTVSEAIFYCDTETNIEYVNPAWTNITGHELQAGTSAKLSQFVHCDDLILLQELQDELKLGAYQVRKEMRVICREGSWRHVEMILSNSSRERKHSITGALIDIDERWHATQAMLEATRKAEELSDARSQFVANMSHEIRTPLNAIIGMSNVLRNTALDHEQSTYVDTLLNGGKALLALVNDILDLSKLNSDELTLERAPYDLLDLGEQCIDVMANAVQEKNLSLRFEVGIGVHREHIGDAHRVRQILYNLISNAIKFTEEGEVILRIAEEDLGAGRLLRIEVKDTGVGISEDGLHGLFDAFTQADASVTRQYGGTGLGLSICKQIVEQMGGRIWVESSVGVGTTFHCDLPTSCGPKSALNGTVHAYNLDGAMLTRVREMASINSFELRTHKDDLAEGVAIQQIGGPISPRKHIVDHSVCSPGRLLDQLRKPAQKDVAVNNRPSTKPQKILLAEDVVPNQLVAVAMLKQLGYENITVVENGQLALDKARKEYFDIALLDIHMPVMDGITAGRALCKEKLVPMIVAASADVTREARSRVVAAGFDDILSKPFTREALEEKLGQYFSEMNASAM